MVIPAAGAAIIVALAGLAIAVCVLVAGQFAFAFIYWLERNALNVVKQLPFVGVPAAGAVNRLIGATWSIAIAYQHVLDEQFYWIHHYFRLVLHFFFAPILYPLYTIVTTLQQANQWLVSVYFVQVQRAFDFLFAHVGVLDAWNDWIRTVYFGQVQRAFDYLYAQAAYLLRWNDFLLHTYFPQVQTTFDAVRSDIALIVTAVRELQVYLPLLRRLAEFETGTVRGIEGLAGRVGELERGEADLARDLAKVLPLALIVAAGAVGIRNLERLARDPCHCLTVGDFNDLPERVAALEVAGD